MSTYRELIFLVSDLVKTISDDTIINENHIMFLLRKYRTYLLKQKYENANDSSVPSSNYQTICTDLVEVPMMSGECTDACICSLGGRNMLRTTIKIPETVNVGTIKVYKDNSFQVPVTVVSPERMEYVGYNTWLQNIIYGSVAPDNYMYFTSNNQSFLKMKRVHISAIFEDTIEASNHTFCEGEDCGCSCGTECTCGDNCECNHSSLPCDEFDRSFPIEDALVTQLLALVIKDILGAAWRPKDSRNNANDDLADLASFIRSYMKKDVNDIIQGT